MGQLVIDPGQFRTHVVTPVLQLLARVDPRLHSPAATELLMGTYLAESLAHGGRTYFRQLPDGPAESPFQIEPTTHESHRVWLEWPRNQPLREAVDSLLVSAYSSREQLCWNLAYACAIARCHFWRRSQPLPEPHDINGLAEYWKRHYNTALGKGDPKVWVRRYRRYCLPNVTGD